MKSVRNCLSVSGRSGEGRARNKRAALARPGVLLAAMSVTVSGAVLWAGAQTGRKPVKMNIASAVKQSAAKPGSLDDLPALMHAYGERQAKARWMASAQRTAQGGALSGPGLVEADLTPNTKSDEREPVFSPTSDMIAFVSNGVDANGDGKLDDAINAENKYHIWVMDRVSNLVYQVTGLYEDKNRDQRHPTWSDDGNILAFVDRSILGEDGKTFPQISLVRPREDNQGAVSGIQPARPLLITNLFAGDKIAPTWSPTGQEIAFACNANLDNDPTDTRNDYDIFTVLPNGDIDSVRRITGGTNDAIGRITDDWNPAYSSVNANAIFFSSNRNAAGRLAAGRRIWAVSSTGTDLALVSDPTQRDRGAVTDIDEYPALSSGNGQELLGFQTNSRVDNSDTSPDGADRNIWTLPIDSNAIIPPAVEDPDDAPHLVVSAFSSGSVERHRLATDESINALVPEFQDTLPGTFSQPEGVDISNGYVYVSNRGAGYVERYFVDSGLPAPAAGSAGSRLSVGGTLKTPSDLVVRGGYVYVANGTGNVAISRYSTFDGLGAGLVGAATDAVFSSGETDANGGVVDGCEGITFGPDVTLDGSPDLYVSNLNKNRVNIYNGQTGVFVGVYAQAAPGITLNFPTGIEFGPDVDGDGIPEGFVASATANTVFVFKGPSSPLFTLNDQLANLKTVGSVVDQMRSPEGVVFANLDGPSEPNLEMYVTAYNGGNGREILRYDYDPATGTFTAAPGDSLPGAVWYRINGNGSGYFDFEDSANNGPATPDTGPGGPIVAVETADTAVLLTNYISSPARFTASGLKGRNAQGDVAGQDKSADIEASFSRSTLSAKLSALFVFSSGRKTAPSPSSDFENPAPARFNPYGGNELTTTGASTTPVPTHDLWTTVTADTTPPILVPQGTGNLRAPFIAPSPNAGFTYKAPRTLEAGLAVGGRIKIAFVLEEKQSGLNTDLADPAVTVTFKDADKPRFRGVNYLPNSPAYTTPNDGLTVQVSPEVEPAALGAFSNLPLAVYDDGPPAPLGNGHERQAGAVAGDGIYYCESTVAQDAQPDLAPVSTPTYAGDFYIDVNVKDVANNSFRYDNIWGFSTKKFGAAGTSTKRDLFVSDYTVGQAFRSVLVDEGGSDSRYELMPPVESYWLNNPPGQRVDISATPPKLIGGPSNPSTFAPATVDVWRTLCRGALTESDLIPYRSGSTLAIDPNPDAPSNNRSDVPPFTETTRKLTVAKTCIIWAAPFAGTVFAGPGTIVDTSMQDILTEFLDSGGRLFLSGRDILWNANGNGEIGNTFFSEKMRASFGGEAFASSLTSEAGSFDNGVPGFDRIEFPFVVSTTNTFWDASLTHTSGAVAGRFDLIAPAGTTTGVTPAYSHNGTPVGQRIVEQYADGAESRVVFFTFNFDAVNRGYDTVEGNYNRRSEIARLIRQFFKTSTITGTVRDNAGGASGKALPNFLVKATSGENVYFARTNAQGQYVFDGLPEGTYTISPYNALKETNPKVVDPNRFYFDGTSVTYGVPGGASVTADDIAVTKYPEGSLKANVVESHSTPDDLTDDLPLPNIQVLVRSKEKSAAFTGGGYYAQLGRTVNATGSNPVAFFQMSNIPPGIQYEVIFNPKLEDIPVESGLRSTFTLRGGQNLNYGRRIIPDTKRPEAITVPASTVFQLNDVASGDSALDEGFPIVVPLGPSVSGKVTVRGVPVAGATVTAVRSGGGVVPKPVVTAADGSYTFADVKTGTYTFNVSVVIDGLTFTGSKTGIVVTQGTDATANVPVKIARITGTVINSETNKVVPNAQVVLQTAAGVTYTPSRTATTNALGKFTLTPLVKGTYKVFARSGSFSGVATATVDVSETGDKDVDVTINLIRQGIYGKVTVNGRNQSGVQVELLRSNGTSFSPAVTTTTDASGLYSFTDGLVLGTAYKVRATYPISDGDVVTVDVTYSKNPTPAPDIALLLGTVAGRVLNINGVPAANVQVTLIRDGVELRTATTNSAGNYVFYNVPGGTYDIRAVLNNTSGSKTGNVLARGAYLRITDIKLQAASATGNPTTFTQTGRYYIISFPYETDNAPATNNKFETGTSAATIRVKDAFDLLPLTTTGVRNYTLERLNPVSGLYERLDLGTDVIERGRGYRLRLQRGPLNMKLSATPLESTQKFFRISLRRNTSSKTNPNNGLNLIGFGINPKTYARFDWSQARVITPNGKVYESPALAAQAGVMDPQVFTLDPTGSTEVTVYRKNMTPFGGYYARTYVDNVTIVLRNPDTK